jgi:hypothetical protein
MITGFGFGAAAATGALVGTRGNANVRRAAGTFVVVWFRGVGRLVTAGSSLPNHETGFALRQFQLPGLARCQNPRRSASSAVNSAAEAVAVGTGATALVGGAGTTATGGLVVGKGWGAAGFTSRATASRGSGSSCTTSGFGSGFFTTGGTGGGGGFVAGLAGTFVARLTRFVARRNGAVGGAFATVGGGFVAGLAGTFVARLTRFVARRNGALARGGGLVVTRATGALVGTTGRSACSSCATRVSTSAALAGFKAR